MLSLAIVIAMGIMMYFVNIKELCVKNYRKIISLGGRKRRWEMYEETKSWNSWSAGGMHVLEGSKSLTCSTVSTYLTAGRSGWWQLHSCRYKGGRGLEPPRTRVLSGQHHKTKGGLGIWHAAAVENSPLSILVPIPTQRVWDQKALLNS